jgi:NAD(P)-dependent dehydrogenase (short-subunit alcohol dehydrogenase family)
MDIAGKVAVVTGGAGGIGKALARRLLAEGAKGVMIADLNADALGVAAEELGCAHQRCDVSDEAEVKALVAATEARLGPIDIFCSNAGAIDRNPDLHDATSASNESWTRGWLVNVMAHVYAARAVLPGMKARGGGYFLHTVSAAGLLSQVDSGPYSVTKHAAVGFAEHLAIAHRGDNIRVSILCPQAVDTAMIKTAHGGKLPSHADGVLSPDAVAACAIDGIKQERFLILPHPAVAEYMANKQRDYDRWIGGMAKLHKKLAGDG